MKRKRILVLCPYPQGLSPGQRLKYEQHFQFWREQGYRVDVSSYMDIAMWSKLYQQGYLWTKVLGVLLGFLRRVKDMFRIRSYDIIYVYMWVTPVGTTLFERVTRALARHLIFDIEDNVLTETKLVRGIHPNLIMSYLRGPAKTKFLMRTADIVVTASPLLCEKWQPLNQNLGVICITPSLDMRRYRAAKTYLNDHKIVIGWTGTFSTRVYLDQLRPVFMRLAKLRAFQLLVIGNFDYDFGDLDGEMIQWSKEREIDDLSKMDIGVYPLCAESDWVLGKAALKAMQYMAMGVPCVATNTSTTPLVVKDGENGLLVNTEDEWVEALVRLIDDPELRQKLGVAGRKTVEIKYSLEAIQGKYINVLSAVSEFEP